MLQKNQLLSEKCQSIESEMFCRNVPIWTSLLTKLSSSLLLPFFIHPPSFSDPPWGTAAQLRSPGLLNFWDICFPELLPTFYAQETNLHQQWAEFIGQGFQSCHHSVQGPSLDELLVSPQPTIHNGVQGTLYFHCAACLLA